MNDVERYTAVFPSVREAAAAAGISTEMLRRMRRQGYVATRERALRMAEACGHHVTAAGLLGVDPPGHHARAR